MPVLFAVLGAIVGSGFGFGFGIVIGSPARQKSRSAVARIARIERLAVLDGKPGEALDCPGCHHPVASHIPAVARSRAGCDESYCRCWLSREDAAKAAKDAVAGELSVLRYGPPLELDSESLIGIRKKLNEH